MGRSIGTHKHKNNIKGSYSELYMTVKNHSVTTHRRNVVNTMGSQHDIFLPGLSCSSSHAVISTGTCSRAFKKRDFAVKQWTEGGVADNQSPLLRSSLSIS